MSEPGFYNDTYRVYRDTTRKGYVLEHIASGATFAIGYSDVSVVAEMLLRVANARWLSEAAQAHSTEEAVA